MRAMADLFLALALAFAAAALGFAGAELGTPVAATKPVEAK